jgi:hypothetical protein
MNRILQLLGRSPLPRHGRLLAAEFDFRHACALLELNERLVACAAAAPLPPRARALLRAELLVKWSQRPLSELIPFANDSLTIQLSEVFQHLHDVDAGDSALPAALGARAPPASTAAFAPSIGPSSHTNPLPTLAFSMRAAYEDAGREADAGVRRALQQRVGYALWTGPSQAATGAHAAGVYLRGRAGAGAAVALFPGAVYSGEMLQAPGDCGHLGDARVPRVLVPRLDEALLDTHAPTPSQRANPYALAHHVRHPPPGVAPNCMRLQVDFVDGEAGAGAGGGALLPFPPHLRPYIPNAWGSDTGTGQGLYSSLEQNIHMKGVALVATRELWDEELFVDHTLNPHALAGGCVPPWALGAWEARRELRRLAGRVSRETEEGVQDYFAGQVAEARAQLEAAPAEAAGGAGQGQVEGGAAAPRRLE